MSESVSSPSSSSSSSTFRYSELRQLPKDLLIELLRVGGTSTSLDDQVDQYSRRISSWHALLPRHLNPRWSECEFYEAGPGTDTLQLVEAYFVYVEPIPYTVYRQLLPNKGYDFERWDVVQQYHEIINTERVIRREEEEESRKRRREDRSSADAQSEEEDSDEQHMVQPKQARRSQRIANKKQRTESHRAPRRAMR